MDAQNPFADVGGTVSGERFIGREEEIRTIRNRLLGPSAYGSLAITGMPRIGKTSLVQKAIFDLHEQLAERRIVATRFDVGTFASINALLSSMVKETSLAAREFGLASPSVHRVGESIDDAPIGTLFDHVRGFFRQLRRENIRAICVLDEFDAGRYLFRDKVCCFHWFRELASSLDFKVGLVIVSKRSLSDIANLAGHQSNYWSNVLLPLPLRVFDSESAEEFYADLATTGLHCSHEVRQEITTLCGTHPYLLDSFAFFAHQVHASGRSLSPSDCQLLMAARLCEFFRQLTDVLKDGSQLSHLVQVLLGPQFDVTKDDVEGLVEYGLLEYDDRGGIRPFASSFGEYLNIVERSVDMWPLWRETEQKLRDALHIKLVEKYGDPWVPQLTSAFPSLQKMLAGCEDKMKKEQTRFGVRASSELLDYTYPQDIFQILCTDWSFLGEPLLGGLKPQWHTKFGVLATVRTPLAHNRPIQPYLKQQAEGCCCEIIARLEAWRCSARGVLSSPRDWPSPIGT